jgi:serine/threonine protein kinase
MELLGESLFNFYMRKEKKVLPMQMILTAFGQIIFRLQAMHSRGYIHRDIKPHNIVLGRKKNAKKLYLVDFGLSRRFCTREGGIHIKQEMIVSENITGTAEFASLNTHRGVTQSRRDDIESLVYSMIFLAKGELPWIGFHGP